ncbi:MAG: hypothetical protein H6R26_3009 [Proteobacteria bacterium]|nr:hypothetical protein [Pseudomonadota bacterium]
MNRKMSAHIKHLTAATFSSLFALALLVPQTAAAVDGKTYNESSCAPVLGNAARFFIGGSINTDPTSGYFVNCPVVRDTIAASGISAASITVRDASPVEDVECTLLSLAANGSVVASSFRKTSGANWFAPQTLNFGGVSVFASGNYKIICRIPKANDSSGAGSSRSQIVSYRVDENE